MSTVNLKKFFYYPAPPPHIINYLLSVDKHFIALIDGQRTMRASEASEQGEASSVKRQASERSERAGGEGTSITPPAIPDSISQILNLVKHFVAFYFEALSIVPRPLCH